jgi:protein gp37
MAENSHIEWTDHTFNPWIGCTKVSPGCDHCYAAAWDARWGNGWGPHQRRRTSPANWRKPLAWDRDAAAAGTRARVFCASLADVFDNDGAITSGWRGDLWHLIHRTPNLDWLLLTKRPQNLARYLCPEEYGNLPPWGRGWPNVWLGTTVENQTEAERRIPHLLATPAAVRFLSCEPLLGPVNLRKLTAKAGVIRPYLALVDALDGTCQSLEHESRDWFRLPAQIDWIICGGESGPGARPMHPDWARSLRDQCQAAGVPFFFKQWGTWGPDTGRLPDGSDPIMEGKPCAVWHGTQWQHHQNGYVAPLEEGDREWVYRLGKKATGRTLDGREWSEMPTSPSRAPACGGHSAGATRPADGGTLA